MKNIGKAKELLLIIILSLLVTGGIILILITPNSGWHPVDDHEFLMWTYLLRVNKVPLWDLISEYNLGNLESGRLRPLYLTMRGIFMYFLGDNIRLYYIWAFIKTTITFILLYYMFREMGAGIIRSYAAVLISMIGYQSCTWWKLGTHEIVTTLWFATGMILMIRYLKTDRLSYAVTSIMSYLIMSLYKESFIVLIPFIILYVIYFRFPGNTDLRSPQKLMPEIFHSVPVVYLITLAMIFVAEVSFILFVIGQDYLGESSGFGPITEGLTSDMKWIVIFGGLMSVIIISRDMEALKIWKEAILLAAFILPQFYLYRSTGITERYLLPFMIGFATFYIVLVPVHMDIGRVRLRIYYIAAGLMLLAHFRGVLIEGNYYRYRGIGTTNMLQTVKEISADKPDAKILSCLYYEVGYTIYACDLLAGYDNVYEMTPIWETGSYDIHPVEYHHYIHYVSSQPEADDLNDFDVIVAYNQQDRHWEYHAYEYLGLEDSEYESGDCGTFTIYVRRDSGIELGKYL